MDKCIQHAVDVVEGRKGNILFRTMLESKKDNFVGLHAILEEKIRQMVSALHILPAPEDVLMAAAADILIISCRLSDFDEFKEEYIPVEEE